MPAWPLFTRRNEHLQTATELYGRLVARSRTPWFYSHLGVPDTPEGRFEMVMAHVVLVIRRLAVEGERGARLARSLTETFVTDMDDCMREMGVGDLMVAKKVKRAAAALYDRNRDYARALARDDDGELAELLARHVRGKPEPDKQAQLLAAYMRRTADRLAHASAADACVGRLELPQIDDTGNEIAP